MSAEWSGSRRPTKRSRQSDSEEKSDSAKKGSASSSAAAAAGSSGGEDAHWRGAATSGQQQQQPFGMYPPSATAPGYPPMHPARYPASWQQAQYPPAMGGGYPIFPAGVPPPFPGSAAAFPPYQQAPPHLPPFYQDPAVAARYPEGAPGDEDPLAAAGGLSLVEDSKPAAKRRKTKTSQDARRNRKNAQSRLRAARLREKIAEIKLKAPEELTPEERDQLSAYEDRRQRKNDRSRDRAIEKKSEMERIMAKPERKRTKQEKKFLETSLRAKQRKNEGDRVRRQRIKHMGLQKTGPSGAAAGQRGGVMTSASLGHQAFMPDIPMSPLPTSHHAHIQSPGTFASPGLIRFPSPPNARTAGGPSATPGVLETPGVATTDQGMGLGFMHQPPPPAYEQGTTPPSRSQLHLPQSSSRVEQRRHPDGSLTISIGRTSASGPAAAAAAATGGGTSEAPFAGDASRLGLVEESPMGENTGSAPVNFSDVSQLLLYGENGEGEGDNAATDQPESMQNADV